MLSQLDELLLLFGQPGRFQVFIAFLLCCIQIPVIFPKILLKFYAAAPLHHCLVKTNKSIGLELIDILPLVNKNDQNHYSSCEMYVDPSDHNKGIQQCNNGWEYMIPDKEWTIVSEWDLVCRKEYLANLLPYLLSSGSIIGSLVFGTLADQCGRKRILLVAVLGNTSVSIALHFSPNYLTFATLYTIIGVFTAGVQCISFVLLLEMLPTMYQLKFCVILSMFWAIGELVLTLLTWPVHHWRFLQLAVSVPGLICVSYFWLLPSSLIWHVVHDRISKAENELERLANYNGISLAPSFRVKLMDYYSTVRSMGGTAPSKINIQSICFFHRFKRSTFILFFLWFVLWFISSTTVPHLILMKESQQLGSLITGFAHLGIIMLIYFVVNRAGPKSVQAALLIFGGMLCILCFILEVQVIPLFKPPAQDYNILILMSRVSATLGKEIAKVSLPCLFFHTGKHFPTFIRASGLGTCFLFARVAEIVTPHVSLLVGEGNWYLCVAACGSLSVLGGLLTFALPNAWDSPLPVVFDNPIPPGKRASKCRALNPKWPYADNEYVIRDSNGTSKMHHSDSLGQNSLDKAMDYSVEGDAFLACLEQTETNLITDRENPSHKMTSTFEPVSGIVFENCQLDSDSHLTDLEDELIKVWELNRTIEEPSSNNASTHEKKLSRDLQIFTRSNRNYAYEEDETVF